MPEQSSVCWHPHCHMMAGVINNPLRFRGELSALTGCVQKNIKGKHSAPIQKSGLHQGAWAHALSCLAHAREDDTPLTTLGNRAAGAKWQGLRCDQPGAGQADGPTAGEARGGRGGIPPPGLCREQTPALSLSRPGILRAWRTAEAEGLAGIRANKESGKQS